MYRCDKCLAECGDAIAAGCRFMCPVAGCVGTLLEIPSAPVGEVLIFPLLQLPYALAITGERLTKSLHGESDGLTALFRLKDCFEAAAKYLSAILLAEYRESSARQSVRDAELMKHIMRPSLGSWVDHILKPLALWLVDTQNIAEPAHTIARLFATPSGKKSGPKATPLIIRCAGFVMFRNDVIGHGADRPDEVYQSERQKWMPLVQELFSAIARLNQWRLCLSTGVAEGQVWMGPTPSRKTIPIAFPIQAVGHFTICGPVGEILDLYPFLSHLPDSPNESGLHYYDSLYQYKPMRKEAAVLEYAQGIKQTTEHPIGGLERTFTADLIAQAFNRHRGKMELIEGRVANFRQLIDDHADITGRRFVVDSVREFLGERDRGLLVIQAEPGKGKTALIAHLIDELKAPLMPIPARFFYRRAEGFTDPDVCVKSLYYELLETHGISESEESRKQNDPEAFAIKLANLLANNIASKLTSDRPQLIFIDALDESEVSRGGFTAFQRLPANLPANVFIIATTRPDERSATLLRRTDLKWYDLDSPALAKVNLEDGLKYVQAQLSQPTVEASSDNAPIQEIAQVGAGNFLVLKLLCNHVMAAHPKSGEMSAFLRKLSTDHHSNDKLGAIYEDFWNRMADRVAPGERQPLYDVAGLMVCAKAPLTREILWQTLGLNSPDLDMSLRLMSQYLTPVRHQEDEVEETFYRIYHESFADFLRDKIAPDRRRLLGSLCEFGMSWHVRPAGYGRMYALRFLATHLGETLQFTDLAKLLSSTEFLTAKIRQGPAEELIEDFHQSHLLNWPEGAPDANILNPLFDLMTVQSDLRIDDVHAWVVFRPKTQRRFYPAFLEKGRAEWLLLRASPASSRRTLARKCLGYLATVQRREKQLAEAETSYQLIREDLLIQDGDKRELAVNSYELGYLRFLRGDLPEAIRFMRESDDLAGQAGDTVGQWISRCILWLFQYRLGSVTGTEYRTMLEAAAHVFKAPGVASQDPRAKRWIANVAFHQFDLAFNEQHADAAGAALDELESDPWMKGSSARFESFRARIAMLRGEWSHAVILFDRFLSYDPADSGGTWDERSRDYLDLGRALKKLDKLGAAKTQWTDGLGFPDDEGNEVWKKQIRAELALLQIE